MCAEHPGLLEGTGDSPGVSSFWNGVSGAKYFVLDAIVVEDHQVGLANPHLPAVRQTDDLRG